MKRDDFVRRWEAAWLQLGMDTLAVITGPRELSETKARTLIGLPQRIRSLLERMHEDLEPTNPLVPANGAVPPAVRKI